MSNKIQRQLVNVAFYLSTATGMNINIPINLRFVSDYAILKQWSFNMPFPSSYFVVQIYTNLAADLIIGSFPLQPFSLSPNNIFEITQGFQSGIINFQIQQQPVSGTGPGDLIASVPNGNLNLIIEFVKHN